MSVHSSSSRGLQVDMSMFTVVGSAYLAYIPRGVMERLKMYLKHKLGHEQRLPRWSVSRIPKGQDPVLAAIWASEHIRSSRLNFLKGIDSLYLFSSIFGAHSAGAASLREASALGQAEPSHALPRLDSLPTPQRNLSPLLSFFPSLLPLLSFSLLRLSSPSLSVSP